MMSLEDEISHLQKENSRIENQLTRMKGDVTSIEVDTAVEDKVANRPTNQPPMFNTTK